MVHLDIAGLDAPYGLAYVDLDNGPRVLVHTEATTPLEVGARVTIAGVTDRGDIEVRPTEVNEEPS